MQLYHSIDMTVITNHWISYYKKKLKNQELIETTSSTLQNSFEIKM
jgi:hypothetical protein